KTEQSLRKMKKICKYALRRCFVNNFPPRPFLTNTSHGFKSSGSPKRPHQAPLSPFLHGFQRAAASQFPKSRMNMIRVHTETLIKTAKGTSLRNAWNSQSTRRSQETFGLATF